MSRKKGGNPTGRLGKTPAAASGTALLDRVRVQRASPRSSSGIVPLVDCHGSTEVGRRRQENEDDFLMAKLPWRGDPGFDQDPTEKRLVPSPGETGFLFVVADGVGAVPCGERASSIAVRSLSRYLKDEAHVLEKGGPKIARTLRRGILRCQSDLRAEGDRRPECAGMSTTLTGVLSLGRRLYVVHSGDSRCYVLRGSQLNLLTRDHTLAQLSIEAGTADRKAARKSPGGNCLWNYLTSDSSTLHPDVGSMPLEPRDILLACTDGLSDSLPAEEIKRHLASPASAEGICRSLVAAARKSGGGDDLTVVVARFGGAAG